MEDFKIDLTNVVVEDNDLEQPKEQTEDKKETSSEEKIVEETNEESTEDNTEDNTEEITQEEHEESVLSEIRKHFGYEIEGEFSEDIEGLKKFTTEVGRKIALEEFQQVFDSYPDVAEYLQYRLNNGDPSKFFEITKETDYSNINLEDNELASKEVLRAFLSKQGFTDEEVNDTITDYEDTGILDKQAKKVLPKLQDIQKREKDSLIKQKEEEKQKELEEAKQYWQTVKQTIDSGNIKNIAIPESDKNKFFEWLAMPKENNMSQRDIDRQSLSPEDMLTLEYFLYKKLDLSKLNVSRQVTKDTEKLRSLLKSKGNSMKGSQSSHKSKKLEDSGIGTILDYIT